MYRILLVEDEPVIRCAMKTLIQWKKYGFVVAAEANHGVEALKVLSNEAIDVVFTDIRMPQMDGIELATRIKCDYPRVYTVLLSAYSEFSYAQQAIQHGVFGYLLKEEGHEKVYDCLISLRKRLDEERQDTIKRQEAMEEIARCLPEEKNVQSALRILARSEEQENDDALPERYGQLIQQAEAYMQQHYAEALTLQHMADHFHISAPYFSRLFSQTTGRTFTDRLIEIRLTESKRLLRETDLKIYEISAAVGYHKTRYFSELFKKQYSISPGEYRMRRG